MEKNEISTSYYVKTSQKVADFLIGFLGSLVLPAVYYFMMTSVFNLIYFVFYWIIILAFSILFFKMGRSFIAIGIISVCLIPLLSFGSCILLLGIGG